MYWPVLQVWCLRACCAPVSSREGHLVPMNTKAATTIQAVGKLTIQESLKLSECISQDNCSSAICWLWFPSSELPETKKSRSEADDGGGSAIKLWLLQRISSISSTRKKMDIICSLYFTQWNTNLFVLPNSYSCNSGMFLSFRSNTDNLDNISRHKECLDSSKTIIKRRGRYSHLKTLFNISDKSGGIQIISILQNTAAAALVWFDPTLEDLLHFQDDIWIR